MSCNRWALRKARRKRPLCRRARRSRLHLVRIIAQEIKLKASRVTRTNFATAPVLETSSRISPPTKSANNGESCISLGISFFWIIDDESRKVSGAYLKHNLRKLAMLSYTLADRFDKLNLGSGRF